MPVLKFKGITCRTKARFEIYFFNFSLLASKIYLHLQKLTDMPKFKNIKTGEIKTYPRVVCFIKGGKVHHRDEDGNELVDVDGNPFEDVSEFDGFCTNFSRFNSLSPDEKKNVLKKRNKVLAENKSNLERKREIDSHSILPPALQEKKKDFDVKRRHYKM